MKSDQLYQELKELAEKLNITVSEQNLRKTGIIVKSGLCKVKAKYVFVMDKNKSVHDKIKVLASCLSKIPNDDIYVVPILREILNEYKDQRSEVGGQRSEVGERKGSEVRDRRSEVGERRSGIKHRVRIILCKLLSKVYIIYLISPNKYHTD